MPSEIKRVWSCDCNPAEYRQRGGVTIDYWEMVRGDSKDAVIDNQIVSPNEIIATPVVYENRIYVAIGQDPVHGPGAGALSCIDPNGEGDIATSNIVWQYPNIGRSMSTVAVHDGLVYAAEICGKINCLDAKSGGVEAPLLFFAVKAFAYQRQLLQVETGLTQGADRFVG